MKLYEINPMYNKVMTIDSPDWEGHPIASDFDGSSKLNIWTPFKVVTTHKRLCNDFPSYRPGVPIVSVKAKNIMDDLVIKEVEFLPLIHDDFNLFIMNVTNVLECVDWERSSFERYPTGKFSNFNKLVFDFNKITSDTSIFKIKEMKTSVFVTDAFKRLIEKNELKGIEFSVVCDSEFTEEMERQQQMQYQTALAEIERNKGTEFSYDEALDKTHEGRAVASREWKMQRDAQGRLWLGSLTLDLTYQWLRPVYIPPILLLQQWHEVEKTDICLVGEK